MVRGIAIIIVSIIHFSIGHAAFSQGPINLLRLAEDTFHSSRLISNGDKVFDFQ
jgi:hypothetical protein